MEIKGTAVKPTIEFIKDKFPDRYYEWLEKLPKESADIIKNPITASAWYPINESTITPTRILAELFYNNSYDAAREVGRYSATKSLSGVYKVFIRIATPNFLISRTANVFGSYYKPSKIKFEVLNDNSATLIIYKFDEVDELMLHRIAGWIERAFELTSRKNVNAEVIKTTVNDEIVYKILASWL